MDDPTLQTIIKIFSAVSPFIVPVVIVWLNNRSQKKKLIAEAKAREQEGDKSEADAVGSYAGTVKIMADNYAGLEKRYQDIVADYDHVNKQFIDISAQVMRLQDQVEKANSLNRELQCKIDGLQADVNQLRDDRANLRSENLLLTNRVTALESGVALLTKQLEDAGLIPVWNIHQFDKKE
jgi:chromosome segregation ATPase